MHLQPVPDHAPVEGPAKHSIAELERYATVLRIDCVRMLAVAKSGHLDSSLSSADVVAALYYRVLRHDPKNPSWPERDRFVLSKGHAAPIQYAALAEHGYFPHPRPDGPAQNRLPPAGTPGHEPHARIEVSTGSLGQGLSMSVGICLALRLDGLSETSHVSTLMSDGDIQEGESWEGAAAAAHFDIPNITAIVDYNHLQTDGTTEEVMDTGDVRAKFDAFGWDSVEIDGHDMGAIVEALSAAAPGPPIRDRLPDAQGPRRVADGGPVGFHGKPPPPEQAARRGKKRGGGGKKKGRGRRRRRRRRRRSSTAADGRNDG